MNSEGTEQVRMSRYKAAALHLAVSAVLGPLVVAAMLYIWYPGPFFTAMGGNDLALQVAGASVLIGPFITLIVFSATKRMALLRMDLAIIGAVQAAMLGYAVYIVAEARPVYVVYAFDRFDIVAASDLREEELSRVRREEFRGIPWGAPRTVAGCRRSLNPPAPRPYC